MNPKLLNKQQLLAVLQSITQSVVANDSFEGSLHYTCMVEGCASGEFMVSASWRVGNSLGQGGCNIVGDEERDESTDGAMY
jgi:hypothetical protein